MPETRAPSPQAPASTAAAVLYDGQVMHARMKPKAHRFAYGVTNLLIDIDRLDEADRMSPLFGVNRRALFGFHERDHGARDGSGVSAYARRQVAAAGVDLTGGRILLLCYPRLLGFVFNPLSVYYCYDRDGALAALIYEVRNTFGEIHSYVRPVLAGDVSPAGVRQEQHKAFYVSPFIAMDMQYRFRMSPPDETVSIRILESDAEGPLLAATFFGRCKPLATPQLLRTFLRMPVMTLRIVAAIHWQALRLWLKGVRLAPRPVSPRASKSARPEAAKPHPAAGYGG